MMKPTLFIILACLLAAPATHAQEIDWNRRIPADTNFVTGRLDNGITYFLRHNEEPKERASFFLVRNAGALLENDEQNGLAHFLEHLAFNGSLHFPENTLISTLQRHGVSYGDNINAYTSWNETVYNICDVPTTDSALIDTCLLILYDWTHFLTLDSEAIDNERGVIMEEWRTRNNSSTRLWKQKMQALFSGSKYAERDVIGDTAVIRSFKPETIRDFYYKWYRTDLEAIVIVGDFDVSAMENKIRKMFANIPSEADAAARPFFVIPPHEETRFCLCTDKEADGSNVQIVRIFREPEYDGKGFATYTDIKNRLVMSLYNTMLSARIREAIRRGNAPFVSASVGIYTSVRGYYSYIVAAQAKPDKEKEALAAILDEHVRVLQHGFAETELDRAKADCLAALESALKEKDKIHNDDYADELQAFFLENEPVIDIEEYARAVKEIIPAITAQEVAEQARRRGKEDNRTVIVSGPSDSVTHITRDEAFAVLDAAETKRVEPYADDFAGRSLLPVVPERGSVTSTKELPAFNAEEWTLNNGARVVFRHADYEKDDVSLYAYSPGGASVYSDTGILPAAAETGAFASCYGLAEFDNTELEKLLAGNTARSSVAVSELYESVTAEAAPKDFETMMQLVYLRFTAPRFDSLAHSVLLENYYIRAKQRQALPQTVIADSLRLILSDHSPRTLLFNKEYIDKLAIDSVRSVYLDRFADASDFIFFIVGNVSADTARLMAEQYLAPIPSSRRNEHWTDRMVRPPHENVERSVAVPMQEPKTTVFLRFEAEMPYNVKDECLLRLLSDVLSTRYTLSIRENEGGTYGVGCDGSAQQEPYNAYSLSLFFDCAPDNANALKPLLYNEINAVCSAGISQEELDKAVKNRLKVLEQQKLHNNYWRSVLAAYYKTGINYDDPANAEDLLRSISVDDVKSFALSFFARAIAADISFVPAQ